jgi:hypothetical protein
MYELRCSPKTDSLMPAFRAAVSFWLQPEDPSRQSSVVSLRNATSSGASSAAGCGFIHVKAFQKTAPTLMVAFACRDDC